MSESVGQAVARVQAPAGLIEASLTEFAKILPAAVKPEQFGRWALSCLKRALADPKQAQAWERVLSSGAGTTSVMSALMDAAALGLEPGREYHLVPFGDVVTGITDYKGEIRLITNAARCTVVAQLVYEKDALDWFGGNTRPAHVPPGGDWFADRGGIRGGFAYVDYGNSLLSDVVIMTEKTFLHHRSKSKMTANWDEWPEAYRIKTLVHQVRKKVPWSAERQWT